MSENIFVRRFRESDAPAVANIIRRGLREVNARDYPVEYIEQCCRHFSVENIIRQADTGHMYVAESEGRILGTGTIMPYWGKETESIILSFYVLVEYIGRGIGRMIMGTLERDEFFLQAERIEIPSAVGAVGFYEKMGYVGKNSGKTPDEEGLVRLEKRRTLPKNFFV